MVSPSAGSYAITGESRIEASVSRSQKTPKWDAFVAESVAFGSYPLNCGLSWNSGQSAAGLRTTRAGVVAISPLGPVTTGSGPRAAPPGNEPAEVGRMQIRAQTITVAAKSVLRMSDSGREQISSAP